MPEKRAGSDDAAVLAVRLPQPTKRLLQRAAALRHKSVSALMRDAAVVEANRILGIEAEPAANAA